MAISDEDLVRQLESIPQVAPPDMKDAVMRGIRAPHPALRGTFSRGRGVRMAIGLAWAAALVIVIGVAIERNSFPWQHSSATMVPLPADQWPVVARLSVPQEARLTIRRSGDRFAIQPFTISGEPVSVAWDQKKLSMTDVLSDTKGPEVVILQRRPGASGSAVIQLNVGGREILKTSISVE
jgi:hypothetical protein